MCLSTSQRLQKHLLYYRHNDMALVEAMILLLTRASMSILAKKKHIYNIYIMSENTSFYSYIIY